MRYENSKGNKVVFGIFDDRQALESAVDLMKARGFRNSDISVLMPTPESSNNFAHEKGTKAPEAATTGAASGMVLGGALGWLVGAGALAIPGLGPLVAAGPIVAAFAGAGAGGAVGGFTGGLIGLGIPEYEAKRYEAIVKDGGMLLSVHADDSNWVDKAEGLLKECGARDISSAKEESSGDMSESERNRPFPGVRPDVFGSDSTRI